MELNSKQKGLTVSIYKDSDPYMQDVDCTLGGVSRDTGRVLLLGCDGPTTVEDNETHHHYPILKIEMYLGKYIRAIPLDKDGCWSFGGNFVYSSDSRFSALNKGFPIPIHDRDMRKER